MLTRIIRSFGRLFRSSEGHHEQQIEAIRRMTAQMEKNTEEIMVARRRRAQEFEKHALEELREAVDGLQKFDQHRRAQEEQVVKIVDELGRLAEQRQEASMEQQRMLMRELSKQTGDGFADALTGGVSDKGGKGKGNGGGDSAGGKKDGP